MRDEDRSPFRFPMFIVLVIAVTIAFVFQQINAVYLHWPVNYYGALSTTGLEKGFVWQLLSFQFLHGGLWHLLFNLVGIWFFGRFCEERFGWRRMLALYFGAGVVGGLLQVLMAWSFPSHFGHYDVYGASAGVCGLLAAFCVCAPYEQILVCFVLPLQARYLLIISVGIALFFTTVPGDPLIAHSAHLGGLLFGAAFVRFGWQDWAPRWRLPRVRLPRRARPIVKVRFPKTAPSVAGSSLPAAKKIDTDFISKEVDPILEKISAHGIQSLTEKERKILEAARAKIRQG